MKKKPTVYTIHSGWGNRISWTDFGKMQVDGHMPRIPEKGDYLLSPMQSGNTNVYRFVRVERTSVVDMFFATVKPTGKCFASKGYAAHVEALAGVPEPRGMHPAAHVYGDT